MGNMQIIANAEQFLIKIDGVSQRLRILGFTSAESISKMFCCNVRFVVKQEADIVTQDALGKSATVEILDEHGSHSRYINGIVGTFAQVEKDDKFTHYEVSLIPEHAVLKYRADCRIYQNKSIEDIIKDVLSEAQIPSDMTRFDLAGTHKPREYCVQFNETDLAFIGRLLAEEGAFYYFEHSESLHKMVVADKSTIHARIEGESTLAFHEQTGLRAEDEYIASFGHVDAIGTTAIALSDYNYNNPGLNLLVENESEGPKSLPLYEYPGKFIDVDTGKLVAKQWIENLDAHKQIYSGNSNVRRLVAGSYFTLKDHPRDSYNQDYVLTKTVTTGAQPAVMEEASSSAPTECKIQFDSIPLSVTFRTLNRPAKGLIHGIQTAVVVGPDGEEIYTDELGRVKIQFHWDRLGERNEKSSCWVRVSQIWAGEGWGALFLPRIGQEVIVSFVDGDPDKPLITGRVYNADNVPPVNLPADKNKSTIKTNSTKGGGGFNELRFDDTKDAEEIFLHGQKDWTIVIENDKHQSVVHDETLDVGNDRTKSVGNNQSESIGKNKTISVGDNHDESIGKNASISIGSNLTESIGKNQNSDVGKNLSLNVGDDGNYSYGKKLTEQVGKDYSLTVGDNEKVSIGKDLSIMVGKKAVISVEDELTLKCGSASIILKKSGKIQIKGSDININGSGNVVIKGSKIAQN